MIRIFIIGHMLMKAGALSQLDIPNLIEEIESMGRSEKRELRSRLTVLLMHLLKWDYQPERRAGNCRSQLSLKPVHTPSNR